jgi:RNA polymerase sigma factor (TIGR02999 family)
MIGAGPHDVSAPAITDLLLAWGEGEPGAFDRLVPLVYAELRQIARQHIRRRGAARSLDTAGLVNEAYLKMAGAAQVRVEDRQHFFALSACAMKQVILSRARARAAAKRGGPGEGLTLDESHAIADAQAEWLLDLDRALEALRRRDAQLARIVELRFFGGMSEEETAAALGVSLRTAQRGWMRARAWLQTALAELEG